MDIIKFKEYLKEAISIPFVLDVVIDNDGNLYDGKNGNDLIKGNVERKEGVITRILGTKPSNDIIDYPLGIDKSGNLHSINKGFVDINGENTLVAFRSDSDTPIPNDNGYWIMSEDYYYLVPITPTGWVNVKIDMEVVKRVRRYSSGMVDNPVSHTSFCNKLDEFKRISTLNRGKGISDRVRIQSELSIIIMLHYLNEIKDFFHPSSSGFLFESFLAGLIPGARIKDDNGKADLVAGNDKYQIKLLVNTTTEVDIVKENEGLPNEEWMDYYIICLKYINKIEILIINSSTIEKVNSIRSDDGILTPKGKFSLSKVRAKLGENDHYLDLISKYSIDLQNIEGKIESIGKGIKRSIDGLYSELSDFQYNIETLVSGTTADGNVVIEDKEFDDYYTKSQQNVKVIKRQLDKLYNNIK
jgi:hypothetical protein